jgi:hypothetical protein
LIASSTSIKLVLVIQRRNKLLLHFSKTSPPARDSPSSTTVYFTKAKSSFLPLLSGVPNSSLSFIPHCRQATLGSFALTSELLEASLGQGYVKTLRPSSPLVINVKGKPMRLFTLLAFLSPSLFQRMCGSTFP